MNIPPQYGFNWHYGVRKDLKVYIWCRPQQQQIDDPFVTCNISLDDTLILTSQKHQYISIMSHDLYPLQPKRHPLVTCNISLDVSISSWPVRNTNISTSGHVTCILNNERHPLVTCNISLDVSISSWPVRNTSISPSGWVTCIWRTDTTAASR